MRTPVQLRPTNGLLILFAFLFFTTVQAQAPVILFQKTLGGSSHESLSEIQRTADGGSIAVGNSVSPASGDKTENNFSSSLDTGDIWVVKLDANGDIQWENTISANSFDWVESVKQTPDGGYIIGANSMSNISGDKTENSYGNADYWIIKLDANGAIQWQKTMGGNAVDILNDVQITSDGGFIVGGYSTSNISGNKTSAGMGNNDMWIIKFDANGNEQWQKSHGSAQHDILNEMKQTSDGGYILGGHIYGYSAPQNLPYYGAYDFYAIKIDAAGNLQWQKTYGGSDDDYIESLQQTQDGGYILGGYSRSNISGVKTENSNGGANGDYWLVKVDASGNIQWQNAIGGSSLEWLTTVKQTQDGGYILGGYSYSGVSGDKMEANQGDADYWIVKTSDMGSIQWQKSLGGSSVDNFQSLDILADGSYILGGWSYSNISGDKTESSKGESDLWIINLSDPGAVNTPSVSDVYYCPNQPAAPLTAIGQNLLWYTTPTGGAGSTTAPTPSTTTSGITTYYVSQTINNIESPRVPVSVVVKPLPSVTISGYGTMCAGTSQTIVAYAGTSFLWNDGVTTGQRVIAPTTTTTYTVTLTGANGCTNTGSRTFIVNQPQAAAILGVTSICNGTSTTLTASGTGTYRWSTGATTGSITVAPSATTTYTLTVTQGNCTSVVSKTLTVNGVAPSAVTIVGLNTQYYKNAPAVTLVGSPSGGTFKVDNVTRTTFNPSQLTVGNHTVNYRIIQSGCTTNVYRTVAVLNPPTTANLQSTTQLAFNGTVENKRIKLEWYSTSNYDYFSVQKRNEQGDFEEIQTVKKPTDSPSTQLKYFTAYDEQPTEGDNEYRIQNVLANGDVLNSNSKTIYYQSSKALSIFPNPASDIINIGLENYVGQPVQIKIYNTLGQIVAQKNIESVSTPTASIELNIMKSGTYLARISSPNKKDNVLTFILSK